MVDKTIGDLTSASSVVAADKFEIENGAGNSRRVLASAIKTYATAELATDVAALDTDLTTHIADTTTHGISTFMATLTSAASLSALLTLLGFTSPATGAFLLPGDILVQYGKRAIGTGGSVVTGTFNLPTAFANTDYTVVCSADGAGNAGRNLLSTTARASSASVVQYEADTGDSSYSINVARNLMWIAIGEAP